MIIFQINQQKSLLSLMETIKTNRLTDKRRDRRADKRSDRHTDGLANEENLQIYIIRLPLYEHIQLSCD